MAVDKGNWFVNQDEIDTKLQNISADGSTFSGNIVVSPIYQPSASGAIPTDSKLVFLDGTSSKREMTLADGTVTGQQMIIICGSVSNTVDVDADFGGTIATATFTAAGQGMHLVYIATSGQTAWFIIGNNGATLS